MRDCGLSDDEETERQLHGSYIDHLDALTTNS